MTVHMHMGMHMHIYVEVGADCLQLEVDGRAHARRGCRLGGEGEREYLRLGDGGGRVIERGEEAHAHLVRGRVRVRVRLRFGVRVGSRSPG